MSKTEADIVTHDGKRYHLADLAHYMEDDHREEIHNGNALHETPQGFWDRFVERFPNEADHLTTIVPEAVDDA